MLNNAEIHALKSILDAAIIASRQDGDDGDPVYHEVNINEVNPFHHKRVQSDVYDRLSEKGFIDGSITQFGDGAEEEHVCITPRGLEALKLSGVIPE